MKLRGSIFTLFARVVPRPVLLSITIKHCLVHSPEMNRCVMCNTTYLALEECHKDRFKVRPL